MAIQSGITSMPVASPVLRRPSLRWSSALNFGDEAISLLAALAVSVLLARMLGPAQFGVYALVMAIVSVPTLGSVRIVSLSNTFADAPASIRSRLLTVDVQVTSGR